MYHIIIQTERRTPIVTERKVYIGEYIDTHEVDEDGGEYTVQVQMTPDDPASWETVTNVDRSRLAIPILEQLHHMGALPENIDDPQFVMVVEWDGISPYVIEHNGDYSARTMEYAGWPQITKEQYDAIQPTDPL
jgi:hypothetical protein